MKFLKNNQKKLIFWLLILVIFGSVFLFIFKFNRNYSQAIPIIGDEPSYMAIADSLVHFKTFDLGQEIETKRWYNFFPQMTILHTVVVGEKQYPKHGLAWPVLFSPLFFLQNNPRMLIMILQNLIVVLLALNIFLWLKELKYNFWLSLFVSLGIIFSLPIAVQAHMLFSEPLAALMLIYTLRKWRKPNVLSVISMMALPWAHIKYIIFLPYLAWPLISINFKKLKNIKLVYPWAVFAIVLSIVGLMIYNYHAFGSIFSGQEKLSSFFNTFEGLFGILINREDGLFTSAPIYLLSFLGLGAMFVRNRSLFWQIAYIVGTLWFVTGIFESWHGGQGPSARMILITLPVLAPALAEVLVLPLKWLWRILFGLLLLPSLAMALFGVWRPMTIVNKEFFPNLNGIFQAVDIPYDVEKWFPLTHRLGWNLNLLWLVIFVFSFMLGIVLIKLRKPLEKTDEIINHYPGI